LGYNGASAPSELLIASSSIGVRPESRRTRRERIFARYTKELFSL
jgi:hypothetical protein